MTTALGSRLRQARETLGWSMLDAAAEMGTTVTSVARWETAQRIPRMGSLNRLARAYALPLEQLVELAVRDEPEDG